MKTQRRHELKSNVLADWLETQIEVLKPHWQIIAGGIAAIAAVIGLIIYLSQPVQPSGDAWSAYFSAVQSPEVQEALRDVVTKNRGTPAAWWAKLASADQHLSVGLRHVFTNKKDALESLEKAHEAYEEVISGAKDREVVRRAKFGLAKTYESLAATRENNDKLAENQAADLTKAAKFYGEVAKDDPEGVIGKQAKHCYQRLVEDDGSLRPSIVSLYESIVTYTPPPNPLGNVFTEADLPEVPDFFVPGEEPIEDETDPGDGAAKGGDPKDSEPKDSEPADGGSKEGEPDPDKSSDNESKKPAADPAPAKDGATTPSGDDS